MINLPRILAGLVLSSAIGYLAYRRHSLTRSGWLGAIITGTLTFGFGGWAFGLTLIAFFLASSALSRYKQQRKQRIAGEKFEKSGERDLGQTLANGGAGALLALWYGLAGEPLGVLALFAGVMATVTADTWATEIGVLANEQPHHIFTRKLVAPGTSGGITRTGTLASAGGALFIGLVLTLLLRIEHSSWQGWLIPAALIGGVGGGLADSMLGATLQVMYRTAQGEETERAHDSAGRAHQLSRGWRWMNNDAVNVLSSLLGALLAFTIVNMTNR